MALPKVWEKITELVKKVSEIDLRSIFTGVDKVIFKQSNTSVSEDNPVIRTRTESGALELSGSTTISGDIQYLNGATLFLDSGKDGCDGDFIMTARTVNEENNTTPLVKNTLRLKSDGSLQYSGTWFTSTNTNKWLDVGYDYESRSGGLLAFRSANYSTTAQQGTVSLYARNSTNSAYYDFNADGSITLNSYKISVVGHNYLDFGFPYASGNGALIALRRQDYTNNPSGWQIIMRKDGSTTGDLYCNSDGSTFRICGRDIMSVSGSSLSTSFSGSGTGYIRFFNGLQICWGKITVNGSISSSNKVVTYPVAFNRIPCVYASANANNGNYTVLVGWEGTTTFTIGSSSGTGLVTWWAIGSWK